VPVDMNWGGSTPDNSNPGYSL